VTLLPLIPRTVGSLLMQPLLWANGTFDLLTHFLGPLGRWLRTPSGKNALGALGCLLFLLAIGWLIVDWMSWTR
jgi:hypothetical protein